MTKLSDAEIAEGLRRYEETTAGNWILFRNHYGDPISVAIHEPEVEARLKGGGCGPACWHKQIVGAWCATEPDLQFIALTHQLLPAALTELQSLRQQLTAVRDKWRDGHGSVNEFSSEASGFQAAADELDAILKGTK